MTHHLSVQPDPMLDTTSGKKCFLESNPNLPWHNLRPLIILTVDTGQSVSPGFHPDD